MNFLCTEFELLGIFHLSFSILAKIEFTKKASLDGSSDDFFLLAKNVF